MSDYSAHLSDKSILQISGSDARDFLQNLISNDMGLVNENAGLYAFLLSAQGKFLHDFFIVQTSADTFLLEVSSDRLPDLKRRLTMLKLRADVHLSTREDLRVTAFWPFENSAGKFSVSATDSEVSLTDGRDNNLCRRVYSQGTEEDYNKNPEDLRQYLASKGIATGHLDFIVDKTTIMEAGLDGQFAVSWTKGCFVGQELTARMKYRGLVKRLLVPTNEKLLSETSLLRDGKSVGVMQSDRFAFIKRDAIDFDDSSVMTESGEPVSFIQPDWWARAEATSAKT